MDRQIHSDITNTRRWGVLVGVNQYRPPFRTLRYCCNDATEIRAVLTGWSESGYAADRVRFVQAAA